MNAARRPQIRHLNLQRLEDRTVCAGNVDAYVNQYGDLMLTGDGAANEIEVKQSGPNEFIVKGWQTINGRTTVSQTGALKFSNVTRNIEVNLQGGNDWFSFGGWSNSTARAFVNGDINVRTGDGDDTVGITDVNVLDDVFVDTGNHKDRVTVGAAQIGFYGYERHENDLTVNTGADGDYVFLWLSKVRDDIVLDTGLGDNADAKDEIMIRRMEAGDFSGWGTYGSIDNDITVRTGGGMDKVTVMESRVRDTLTVDTGDQADELNISEVQADAFYASLGGGDDAINVGGLTARSAVIYGGSSGGDTYRNYGNNNFSLITDGVERFA